MNKNWLVIWIILSHLGGGKFRAKPINFCKPRLTLGQKIRLEIRQELEFELRLDLSLNLSLTSPSSRTPCEKEKCNKMTKPRDIELTTRIRIRKLSQEYIYIYIYKAWPIVFSSGFGSFFLGVGLS